MFHLVPGIGLLLASVPVEMHIKALRWRSSKRRADRRTLASHRCLEISASSRNGLPRSKMRTLPIYSFISHHTALSGFHFHSFFLYYKKTEDYLSFLCPPWCQNRFTFPSSSLWFFHLIVFFSFHHHPTAGLTEKNSSNNSCSSHTPGSNNKITNPVLIIEFRSGSGGRPDHPLIGRLVV